MMPALPAAPFVVIQPQFLFQLLVVLFHPPAEFSQPHPSPQRDFLRQVRKPIFGRRFCVRRPLGQKPDRLQLGLVSNMTMSRLHSASGEAAALWTLSALSPSDLAPRLRRQGHRQITQGCGLPTI